MKSPRDCGCCEGIAPVVPLPVYNRPGLTELKCRIGTQATFFESLIARLSTYGLKLLDGPTPAEHRALSRRDVSSLLDPKQNSQLLRTLLTTRDKRDPAIALLDAWATLADSLAFYTERFTNESFLRTARERRSLDELARLVGYQIRPGLSSTVYLAFEVDDTALQPPGTPGSTAAPSIEVKIPAGTAAKSTPTPVSDDVPQTFETRRDLIARKDWNAIKPRQTRPQRITAETVRGLERLYFKGLGLRLQPNDYLAVLTGPEASPVVHRIVEVKEDPEAGHTLAILRRSILLASDLLDTLQQLIDAFPSGSMPSHQFLPAVLPDAAVAIRDEIRERFLGLIQRKCRKITLVEIDSEYPKDDPGKTNASLHYMICNVLVDDTSVLRQRAAKFLADATSLKGEMFSTAGTLAQQLLALETRYQHEALERIRRIKWEDEKLVTPVRQALEAASIVLPDVVCAIKQGLRLLAGNAVSSVDRPFVISGPAATNSNAGSPPLLPNFSMMPDETSGGTSNVAALIMMYEGIATATLALTIEGYAVAPAATQPAPGFLTIWELKEKAVSSGGTAAKLGEAFRAITITPNVGSVGTVVVHILERPSTPTPGPDPKRIRATSCTRFIHGSGTFARTIPAIETTRYCQFDATAPGAAPLDPAINLSQKPGINVLATIDVLTSDPATPPDFEIESEYYEIVPGTARAASVKRLIVSRIVGLMIPSGNEYIELEAALNSLRVICFSNIPFTVQIVVEEETSSNALAVVLRDVIPLAVDHSDDVLRQFLIDAHARLMSGQKTDSELQDEAKTLRDDLKNSNYWKAVLNELPLYASAENLYDFLDDTNPKHLNLIYPIVDAHQRVLRDVVATIAIVDGEPVWGDRLASLEANIKADADSLAPFLDNWIADVIVWMKREEKKYAPIGTFPESTLLGLLSNTLVVIRSIRQTDFSLLVNDLYARLGDVLAGMTAAVNRALWLTTAISDLANAMTDELNLRRRDFVNEIIKSFDRYRSSLAATPASGIDPVPVFDGLRSTLRERQARLERLLTSDRADSAKHTREHCETGCGSDVDLCVQLKCLTTLVKNVLNIIPSPLESEPDVPRLALRALVHEMSSLVLLVAPDDLQGSQSAARTAPRSIDEIVQGLRHLQGERDPQQRRNVRNLTQLFMQQSDLILQVSGQLDEVQRRFLYEILRQARVDDPQLEPKVYAFRSRANIFGWNASDTAGSIDGTFDAFKKGIACIDQLTSSETENAKTLLKAMVSGEAALTAMIGAISCLGSDARAAERAQANLNTMFSSFPLVPEPASDERGTRVYLDGEFLQSQAGSVIGFLRQPSISDGTQSTADEDPQILRIRTVVAASRSAYGLKNNTTIVDLLTKWWNPSSDDNSLPGTDGFDLIRQTKVFCDAEELPLAEEPILDTVGDSDSITLDEMLDGLGIERPVFVVGPPQVLVTETTVNQAEMGRLNLVRQDIDPKLFGDRFRTTIQFDHPLNLSYSRKSAVVNANVVEASHGETQKEVLGSGDGTREFQEFLLKRPELSLLPAPTPRGTESTLTVRVNDVAWAEQESLKDSQSSDEDFVAHNDAALRTTVSFGDGERGARVPSGVENIRAQYRVGAGRKGNVAAGQINQAVGAPLGVKGVRNPLAAHGGTDADSPDFARSRVPLSVTAIDRLVSVDDFADFARSFAGVGKASATRLYGAVQVTVAGVDPEPLDDDGPCRVNLRQAMELFGDPSQQFQVRNRLASLLIIVARVKIDPRREWAKVKPAIRQKLLDWFSYENSDLGEDLLLSDTIALIQRVDGVVFVDVDVFDAISELELTQIAARLSQRNLKARIHVSRESIFPGAPAAPNGTSPLPTRANSNASGSSCPNASRPVIPRLNAGDILPAQLCYLSPDVPDTLILEQIR
jgi:hypothetical protein